MMHAETHIPTVPPGAVPTRRSAAKALRRAALKAGARPEAEPRLMSAAADARPHDRRSRPSPLSRLPELAPPETESAPSKSFVGIEMSSTAIKDEETRFSRRAETSNETARLTVYAMNATLLILAFPVGFGLLVFNILGGENLRTTAHVMALTGFGIALSAAGMTSGVLPGI